eukprot:gene15629-17528_t
MSYFIDSNSFPKIGVHLDYIELFISDNGGVTKFQCPCEEDAQKLRSLTTAEVVERFIKPQTQGDKVSYCEYLLKQGLGNFIGEPNVFISHGWGDSFLELKDRLSSLKLPENHPKGMQEDLILWLDIFSNNQHTTTQKPHDWWKTVFYEAVNEIHCTVFMLTPNAVTRAWCIWELFATIDSGSHFQIATSQTLSEKTRKFLFGPTIKIDSATSECRDLEDRERLREAIGLAGFETIDSLVSKKMNEEVQRLRGLVKENIKEALPIVPREIFVGINVDFSASMQTLFESLRSEANGKTLTRHRYAGEKSRFFVCAFGLQGAVLIGDLVHMIRFMVAAFKISRELLLKQCSGKDLEPEACWENLIQFLEKNGAPYIKDYAYKNKQHFSSDLIKFLLPIVKDDKSILERLVARLPDCCKSMVANTALQAAKADNAAIDVGLVGLGLLVFGGVGLVVGAATAGVIMARKAAAQQVAIQVDTQSEQSAKSIVEQTIKDVNDNYLQPQLRAKYGNFVQPLDKNSLITHEELQSLLNDWKYLKIDEQHSFLGEFNLFNANLYGLTPLYQTYSTAWEMFRGFENEEIGKVLLTISDGDSTCETALDESRGKAAIESLKQMNVQLVNCFLSTESSTGKQLLSQRPKDWSKGPAFLFDNASEVKKDHPALLKLQAKGWDLSKFEEKYRAFFHANTSEIIDTFIEVALDLTK